ncbi:RHS repeat-associated core domain-containing protein, partial [Burkholderia ubonensis]|uniref:RHS repeat-associated core domain-containing protein n=1 Tax=Burkholderia ubonensis TaxID=101571 RepID=UPI000AB6CC44
GYRHYAPWLARWLNPDPAGTVDGLNLFRFVRNNPGTLRDTDGRIPVFPTEAAKETAPHSDSIENMEQLQQYILRDYQVNKFIKSPKDNCENAARRVSALLNEKGIKFQIGGMLFWKSLLDTSPGNHYIVIAEVNLESIYIDITASQFRGSSGETMRGPFFGLKEAWETELLKVKSDNLTKFRIYPSVHKAALEIAPALFVNPIYSIEELPLISPKWYMRYGLGEAERRAQSYHEVKKKKIAVSEQRSRREQSSSVSRLWNTVRRHLKSIRRGSVPPSRRPK